MEHNPEVTERVWSGDVRLRPYPVSPWVKEPASAEDLRRVEEKVDRILRILMSSGLEFVRTASEPWIPK